MRFGSILALSVGLAMDATAVSAARGMAVPRSVRATLLVALYRCFQALMPVLGYCRRHRPHAWDH
jgi:putative Mn2+ efflux pump MntP